MSILITDFLAQKRIAVAGVSCTKTNEAANLIYRKLRARGFSAQMFALVPAPWREIATLKQDSSQQHHV